MELLEQETIKNETKAPNMIHLCWNPMDKKAFCGHVFSPVTRIMPNGTVDCVVCAQLYYGSL
jgi:hypothetical protein